MGKEKGRNIARKAMLAKVNSNYGTHYILEIERKKGVENGKLSDKDNFAMYIYANKTCTEITLSQHFILFQYLAETSLKRYKKTFGNLGYLINSRKYDCAQSIINKLRLLKPSL